METATSRTDPAGLPAFAQYSLEEQVVASYLQSLEWSPCATIKLDAQDNPYIGSMLHTARDLRHCKTPGGGQEERKEGGQAGQPTRSGDPHGYLAVRGRAAVAMMLWLERVRPMLYRAAARWRP